MISYQAFHSEFVKIAEEQKKDVTKERLKRLAIGAGATGAGAFLGHGLGRLIRRQATAPLSEAVKKLPRHQVAKYGPTVVGAGSGLTAALIALHRKKMDKYVDEGERPKQHRP